MIQCTILSTVNPQSKPLGLINFMVHKITRVEIETLKDLKLLNLDGLVDPGSIWDPGCIRGNTVRYVQDSLLVMQECGHYCALYYHYWFMPSVCAFLCASWKRLNIDFVPLPHPFHVLSRTKKICLKGRIVQPPKTGLKCTSAAAPTLQQTVACQSCPLRPIYLHWVQFN